MNPGKDNSQHLHAAGVGKYPCRICEPSPSGLSAISWRCRLTIETGKFPLTPKQVILHYPNRGKIVTVADCGSVEKTLSIFALPEWRGLPKDAEKFSLENLQ